MGTGSVLYCFKFLVADVAVPLNFREALNPLSRVMIQISPSNRFLEGVAKKGYFTVDRRP